MRWARFLFLVWCLTPGSGLALAQSLESFFPQGVPGYGTEAGVTVLSRARPDFDPLGIRLGTLMLSPSLNESFGYDDNIFGGPARTGAWEVQTQPSLLLSSQQSDRSLGAYFSATDVRYLGQPSQNRTDGSAFLGGSVDFGQDKLTLGAGYLSAHESRTALDALPSDRPVGFQVANARAAYDAVFAQFRVTPSIEIDRWRFDNTTVFGVPVSEAARDRTTVQGSIALAYTFSAGRELRIETGALNTTYDSTPAGIASNNSVTWRALAGLDYDDDTVWRYRMMGGIEVRQPASGAVATQTTGVGEGELVWSPSGMTTISARALRGIEDAAQTGLSNYTYTGAMLRLDHELLRNILLNAEVQGRQAHFNQTGGDQVAIGAGLGATWLMNRNLRLGLSYDFSDVRNSHLSPGSVAGNYVRDLTLLTLRIGL